MQQPELSKKLFKMIKSENHTIGAYESASRERISIAAQLSDWGEATGDDAISDISDKLGVLLSELGEQEDVFAQNLEDYRTILKQIRNTESSVQPSRDHKAKISDEIQKLKYKEPQSTKLVTLEQELVRAEAQNLVAEAQLTNIVRTIHNSLRILIQGQGLLTTIEQTDSPEAKGGIRHPLRRRHRARRKTNPPSAPRPPTPQPPRRHPRRPGRYPPRIRTHASSPPSPQRRRRRSPRMDA